MKEHNSICAKDVIAEKLIARVRTVIPGKNAQAKGLYRFSVDVGELLPLDWLCNQKALPRTYWSARDRDFEMAGVGAVETLRCGPSLGLAEALGAIEESLASAQGDVRYYGGICFDREDRCSGPWRQFGRFYFVVPEFELCKTNDGATFAFNIACRSGCRRDEIIATLLSSLESLTFSDEYVTAPFAADVLERRDCPKESRWNENILQATDELRFEDTKKMVLSRKSVFLMSQTVDPVALLKEVSENSFRTYDFCFQLDEANAFIGCSPECLYRRDLSNIYTEAIAGTCLAGRSDAEQQCFQQELLRSHKEAEEHEYVFEDVKSDLSKICREIRVLDERDILSLSYVQHFCSRFSGILSEDVNTQQIIEALHPTAAVHGYPKGAANSAIKRYEPFSRGWYAGPVGWIGADSAEFAVAIRSGLVQGREISLFAGAGIVRSSAPASEWSEIENKLRPFLEVIVSNDPVHDR